MWAEVLMQCERSCVCGIRKLKKNVMEMENFSSLVERNEGLILNYFVNGDKNAIDEAMNSKIQRMITLNKGTKNKEFFWHKMKNTFSITAKWN